MQAVPLLAVPVVQAVRAASGADGARLDLQIGTRGAMLRLEGSL